MSGDDHQEFDFLAAETIADIPVRPPPRSGNKIDDPPTITEQPADPFLGRTLGLYRVMRKIGSGAMGVVYVAEHTTYGDERALKVLTETAPASVQRFQREARALLEVRHPNVVQVVDFGTTKDGINFLVMELVRGERFNELLFRCGPLPEQAVLPLTMQIVFALAVVHRAGFIHRDLKPGNIIAVHRPEGVQLKLLDFGLAALVDSTADTRKLTRAGYTVGTPGFMAPESITGGGVSPKSDLYAVGAILYEMLTGRPPFDGESVELLKAHAREPVPPIGLEGALADLAMALLRKDPDQRPDTGRVVAMLHALYDRNA